MNTTTRTVLNKKLSAKTLSSKPTTALKAFKFGGVSYTVDSATGRIYAGDRAIRVSTVEGFLSWLKTAARMTTAKH
jgi:hypothetical protein